MKINRFSIKNTAFLLLMLTIGLSGFHWQCAAVAPPSGGPKDETPPALVSVVPESGTIHFTGQPVTLIFTEYLSEGSVEKAIAVFPRLPEPVSVKFKGTELIVSWPDGLAGDQTYILTIGRSLMDEHNVKLAETIQLAYSTGEKLAQGEISGKVFSDDESVVHLWRIRAGETADSVLFREPDYVTETTKDGRYRFQYLSPGDYQVCAVGLENSGQILIPDRMKYGLSWEPVLYLEQDGVISGLNMMRALEPQPLRVTKGEWITPAWGKIYFTEPVSAEELNLSVDFMYNDSVLTANPLVYDDPQDPQALIVQTDSLAVEKRFKLVLSSLNEGRFPAIDSTELVIRLPSEPDTSYLSLEYPKGTFPLTPELGNLPVLSLIFSEPVILNEDIDSVISFIRTDSVETEFRIVQESPVLFTIELMEPWAEYETYVLTVDSAGMTGINGRGLKSAGEIRKIMAAERQGYGGLVGTVTGGSMTHPVAKISEVEKPENFFISVVNSASGYQFETIPDGQYMFMLFDDMDNNRRYSTGLARPYQPAEWFWVLEDTVEIRANWDIELDPIILKEN